MRALIAISLALVAAPASAASYKVVLDPPPGTQVVWGHGGLHAVDDRNDKTLVRIVAPGSNFKERGTIRVMVMNKSVSTFPFGPNQVKLELADGTRLKPVPISKFIEKAELVEREVGKARTVDQINRSSIEALARQGAGTPGTIPSGVSVAPRSGPANVGGLDLERDELMLPGAKTLDAIYQVLETQPVALNQGWGGYYVFSLPKDLRSRKADQPLTITITTGSEVRRFNATLQYR